MWSFPPCLQEFSALCVQNKLIFLSPSARRGGTPGRGLSATGGGGWVVALKIFRGEAGVCHTSLSFHPVTGHLPLLLPADFLALAGEQGLAEKEELSVAAARGHGR